MFLWRCFCRQKPPCKSQTKKFTGRDPGPPGPRECPDAVCGLGYTRVSGIPGTRGPGAPGSRIPGTRAQCIPGAQVCARGTRAYPCPGCRAKAPKAHRFVGIRWQHYLAQQPVGPVRKDWPGTLITLLPRLGLLLLPLGEHLPWTLITLLPPLGLVLLPLGGRPSPPLDATCPSPSLGSRPARYEK